MNYSVVYAIFIIMQVVLAGLILYYLYFIYDSDCEVLRTKCCICPFIDTSSFVNVSYDVSPGNT
jgi:hypothetical protein